MRYFILVLATCFAVLAGCADEQSKPPASPSPTRSLVMSEGTSSGDGLSISNGNVVVKENEPGIVFATVTTPGQPRRIVYFVVFNHDRANAGINTEAGSTGATADTFHRITTYGKTSTVRYEVVLKNETESIEAETITIDDKVFDSTQGRVFLIDMKQSPPSVTQFNVDLPVELPELTATDATEQFAQDTLDTIRTVNDAVDTFCRTIETGDD